MKRTGSLFFALVASCWIGALPALASEEPLNVVVSVIPVAYIVEELGGERVRVDALVPPGASPHTFEPVPSDLRKLARARYFIGIGGGLDAWSGKLLAAAPKGIETVHLIEAPNLDLLEGEDHHHHHEEESGKHEEHHGEEHHKHHGEEKVAGKDDHHGEEKVAGKEAHHGEEHHKHHGEEKAAGKDDHHGEERHKHHGEEKVAGKDDHHGEEHAGKEGEEHGAFDPHFWLDPIRVRDALVPALAERLAAADPAGKEYYEKRRQDFHRRLTVLDQEIRAELDKAKTRKYIAFHAAWPYFAQRYGLERVAVVQEFAGEEPTPRELAGLVRDARAAGVGAILVEPQLNPRVAQTVAAEFGAGTVVVDPLGDSGDPARDSYEDLLRFNAQAFMQAFGAKPK